MSPDLGGRLLSIEPTPPEHPDAQALMRGMYADLDERYREVGEAPMTADEFAERVIGRAWPPSGAFVVTRLDGDAVGCGGVVPLDVGPGVGEVKRLFVAAAARGLRLSRMMVSRLEAEASALGYRRLQLETGRRQHEALGLYRSADGWYEIERFGEYADDRLSVCFAKDLSRD